MRQERNESAWEQRIVLYKSDPTTFKHLQKAEKKGLWGANLRSMPTPRGQTNMPVTLKIPGIYASHIVLCKFPTSCCRSCSSLLRICRSSSSSIRRLSASSFWSSSCLIRSRSASKNAAWSANRWSAHCNMHAHTKVTLSKKDFFKLNERVQQDYFGQRDQWL